MSDIKISDLQSAASVGATDVLPIVQGGITKKAAASLIGIGGSIDVTQVAVGSGTNTVVGDPNLTFVLDQLNVNGSQSVTGNAFFADIFPSTSTFTPIPQPAASEGMVYQDFTDHHLWHYDGTAWEALGAAYIATNTARVDPTGDDSTGVVGDLTKPFLTCQGALTALEAQGGFTSNAPAIVQLPFVDTVESVSTSLQFLVIQGLGFTNDGTNPALANVTLTNDGTGSGNAGVRFGLTNVWVSAVTASNITGGRQLTITLDSSQITGDLTSTSNNITITATYNTGAIYGTITSASGGSMTIRGLVGAAGNSNFPTINAPTCSVAIYDSLIDTVTAAGTIDIYDSVITTNHSGVVPTHHDSLLNPANMDFSTLPTTNPHKVGKAWVDTTAAFVVKVSQG